MRVSIPFLLPLAILALAGSAAAGTLTGLTVPPSAKAGAPVPLLVTKSGPDCGFKVWYGDGQQALLAANSATKTWNHTWSSAGTYEVSIQGKKKNQKPACNGSFPLTATIQVTANLGRAPAAKGPAAKGALGKVPTGKPVKPGPPSFEGMCDHVACVEKVETTVQGNEVTFTVDTSNPSKIGVFASEQPLTPGHEYSTPLFQLVPGMNQHATVKLGPLEPGKQYHYLVKSQRDHVDMWKKGTFSTKPLEVILRLQKITVYDDGDPGISGKGEFMFYVQWKGEKIIKWSADLNDGDTRNPMKAYTFVDPPETIKVRVSAYESDSPLGHQMFLEKSVSIPSHAADGWSTTEHLRFDWEHFDVGMWLQFEASQP